LEDRRVMAVDFASAFSVGGGVFDLALDGAGNTCVVGAFFGTTDFDPGPGTYELTPEPGGDLFAAKYDPAGNLLWAQRMDGGAPNFGPEIAAGSDGSVYVVGSFKNTGEFGATTLTSLGDYDAFVTKFDADGNIVWANRFGGAGADWGNDVAVDPAGNVYVMAETRDAGNPDAFIAKMDAGGNVLWSREIGASSSTSTKGKTTTSTGWARGYKLTVDDAGNVYGTGRISGTVDFDAGAGTTAISGTGFVTKLSTNGNLVWARAFTGASHEAHDIAVDSAGNVYTTGLYSGSVDFDPGTGRTQKFVLSATYRGTYVTSLDLDGNFRWAKSIGGADTTNWAWPEAMTADGAGNVYLAGYFVGTVDFDPGSGLFNLTSTGGNDAFVWELASGGTFAWAGQMGGAGNDTAYGVGVDAAGNIYAAGNFNGTADLDPGAGTYNVTSVGSDFFVAKLVQPVSLAAAASQWQSESLLSTTTPTRRLSSKAADGALADLGDDDADAWNDSLDDELLLVLASS
jgi:hypothetical protein